jgi:hypothetical protein
LLILPRTVYCTKVGGNYDVEIALEVSFTSQVCTVSIVGSESCIVAASFFKRTVHLLVLTDFVLCRREATTSNLATLNALNRQLKRNYLKNKDKEGSNRYSISPVTVEDSPPNDGRVSEYVERYIPWDFQKPVETQQPKFTYTPIPYSAEAADRTMWKSQQKLEQEETLAKAAQAGMYGPDAAGVRYSRGEHPPTFYAWNPETGRMPANYEAEDPDIEAGGIQHKHAEPNNRISEYDLKYKWLPFEEVI